jgi:hypothetical protein
MIPKLVSRTFPHFAMAVLGTVLFDASLPAPPPALDSSLNPKLVNTSSGDMIVTIQSASQQADGKVDESLGLGLDGRVYSAALQADGRLVIAGSFTTVKGTRRVGIARIAPDGTLDAAFNPNPDEAVIRHFVVRSAPGTTKWRALDSH